MNLTNTTLALTAAHRPDDAGQPRHDALALTSGGLTALIDLNGCIYTLRITRQGKLILTK